MLKLQEIYFTKRQYYLSNMKRLVVLIIICAINCSLASNGVSSLFRTFSENWLSFDSNLFSPNSQTVIHPKLLKPVYTLLCTIQSQSPFILNAVICLALPQPIHSHSFKELI